MKLLRSISHLMLLTLSSLYLQAQDANYWSSGYGPGGFLTPGAVIAYNRDSGVLFYNPALLAYTHKNSASITGNIYQYESTTIKNGVGSGLDLHSAGGSIIPQMVAGSIAMNGKKPFVIGYALIRNPLSGYQANQRKDARFNVLDDSYSPGPEYFVGQYSTQNLITETSGLLSIGFRLSENWSAGFSMEGQIRNQNYMESYDARALYNIATDTLFPPIANVTSDYQLNYTHVGIRFKGGLSYNARRHHLGLLISSPLIHLWGKGTLYADNEISDLKQGPLIFNLLANTRQTGLVPRWKVPLSLGLGYAYDYNDLGQIYFAAEYFAGINTYNVITPRNDYFIRPDTGSNNSGTADLLRFRDQRKAVLNVALGYSFPVQDKVQGYIAIRTDFTYTDDKHNTNTDYMANTSDWNLWHLQLGTNFKKRKFNLRPGLLLSYGTTNKYMQPVNYDNPHENNFLTGDPHLVKASRFSAGLMFSYIHNL
jgi:hypothetical protein